MKLKFIQVSVVLGLLLAILPTQNISARKSITDGLPAIAKTFEENEKQLLTIYDDIFHMTKTLGNSMGAEEGYHVVYILAQINWLIEVYETRTNALWLYSRGLIQNRKMIEECKQTICKDMVWYHAWFALNKVNFARMKSDKILDVIRTWCVNVKNKAILHQIDNVKNIIIKTTEQIDKDYPENAVLQFERTK